MSKTWHWADLKISKLQQERNSLSTASSAPNLETETLPQDLRSTSLYGIKEVTLQLTQIIKSYEDLKGNVNKQVDSSTEYNNMFLQLIYIHRSTSPLAHEYETNESVSIADKLRYNSKFKPSAHHGAIPLLTPRPLPSSSLVSGGDDVARRSLRSGSKSVTEQSQAWSLHISRYSSFHRHLCPLGIFAWSSGERRNGKGHCLFVCSNLDIEPLISASCKDEFVNDTPAIRHVSAFCKDGFVHNIATLGQGDKTTFTLPLAQIYDRYGEENCGPVVPELCKEDSSLSITLYIMS